MGGLSQPFDIRGIKLGNRIMVSPMCTYSCSGNGMATDWHFAHYARLAMGGAGLVMVEATSIDLVGRHSCPDLGIWSDDHVPGLRRITDFIRAQGAVPAIQSQHAGRKASARPPWHGGAPMTQEDVELRGEHPWQVIGPSPIPLSEGKPAPIEIRGDDIPTLINT